MAIPIGSDTFKRDFLNGRGRIDLKVGPPAGGAISLDKQIPDNVDSIFLLGVGRNAFAEIGRANGLSMKLSFEGSAGNGIRVVRPGAYSDFLNDRGLDNLVKDGELGIHLFFDAKAGANVAGSLPAGPAGFAFGIQAEGSVGYDRFFVVHKDDDAGPIILRAMSDVRLPQLTGEVKRIPAPGEVLVFRYSGFLDMKAGLNWGYQIHGLEDFEIRDLEAGLEYDVRLKAGVELGYRLAGDFEIETRRGSSENYVRLLVRKNGIDDYRAPPDSSWTRATS